MLDRDSFVLEVNANAWTFLSRLEASSNALKYRELKDYFVSCYSWPQAALMQRQFYSTLFPDWLRGHIAG
ncbi:unnamed protein product [Protopolystoma xenopodis]|uniref:Uncharacterized protein n=1 Tax=Protopolystoma xenopodis TaxID=117903 RepID=A0A3S5A0D6_9PLAT|nr:unnamed protein product [Protopolystoma xenopodis]